MLSSSFKKKDSFVNLLTLLDETESPRPNYPCRFDPQEKSSPLIVLTIVKVSPQETFMILLFLTVMKSSFGIFT